jgi:hypothetical protein
MLQDVKEVLSGHMIVALCPHTPHANRDPVPSHRKAYTLNYYTETKNRGIENSEGIQRVLLRILEQKSFMPNSFYCMYITDSFLICVNLER